MLRNYCLRPAPHLFYFPNNFQQLQEILSMKQGEQQFLNDLDKHLWTADALLPKLLSGEVSVALEGEA
jgi:hypothetical protein